MAVSKKALKPATNSKQGDGSTVIITQQVDRKVYNRAKKYAGEFGLISVQNVIRVSLSQFLNNQGY